MLDDIDASSLEASIVRLSPERALSDAGEGTSVDVFVVDGTNLSMAVSFNTLPELRTRDHSRHAAILFVHNSDDADIAASALDSAAPRRPPRRPRRTSRPARLIVEPPTSSPAMPCQKNWCTVLILCCCGSSKTMHFAGHRN